jgi:hypothetical protein
MKAHGTDTVRTHIALPKKLVEDIDKLVGARGRSAFIADIASTEVKRRSLLAFLEKLHREGPAWKDEDHPELAQLGTAEYVHQIREGKSDRKKWLETNWYNRK